MPGKSHPRVLVVNNEPFQRRTASGNTLCALFRGWPRETLACLFDSGGVPDREICARYWKVGRQDLRGVRCVSNAFHLRRLPDGVPTEHGTAGKPLSVECDVSLLRSTLHRLRRVVSGQGLRDLDDYCLRAQIADEIDAFAPEMIYTTINRNPMMGLALHLAKRFAIPILPHFLDDWVETAYRASVLSPFLRRVMHRRLSEILTRAPRRLAISEAMAEEYGKRYGGEFLPFMNAVEDQLLDRPYKPPPAGSLVSLVYVGALHIGRWRSLLDIGNALRVIRGEGYAVEATVFAPSYFVEEIRRIAVPPVMRYGGELKREEVEGVLENAHVLILPEGFGRVDKRYTRFSLSTKVPEYLCAGRPILAYGPGESGSIRYLSGLACGPVVTRRDERLLLTALRDLVRSGDAREVYGHRARRLAGERFSATLQSSRFRSVVGSTIASAAKRT